MAGAVYTPGAAYKPGAADGYLTKNKPPYDPQFEQLNRELPFQEMDDNNIRSPIQCEDPETHTSNDDNIDPEENILVNIESESLDINNTVKSDYCGYRGDKRALQEDLERVLDDPSKAVYMAEHLRELGFQETREGLYDVIVEGVMESGKDGYILDLGWEKRKGEKGSEIDFMKLYRREHEQIGKGAFGTCYLLRSSLTDEYKIMKRVRRKRNGDISLMELIMLAHVGDIPGCLRVSKVFISKDEVLLVFPYFSKQTLRDRLQSGGPLSKVEWYRLAQEMASILDYLQDRHIVHFDIKSENVLWKPNSLWGSVLCHQLIDFNLACLSSSEKMYKKRGTKAYMAPELSRTESIRANNKVDMWSLGILLFEAYTGITPDAYLGCPFQNVMMFSVNPLQEICHGLPVDVVNILEGLLQINPAKRWGPSQLFDHIDNRA